MEIQNSKYLNMRLAFGVLSEAKTSIIMDDMEIVFSPPSFGSYLLFTRELGNMENLVFDLNDLDLLYKPLSIIFFGKNVIPDWFNTFLMNLTNADLLRIIHLVKNSVVIDEIYSMYGLDKIKASSDDLDKSPKKKFWAGSRKINYWEMMGNVVKFWGISFNEVIWGLSYQNILLMNMSIPKFDKEGNKIEAGGELTGMQFLQNLKAKKDASK